MLITYTATLLQKTHISPDVFFLRFSRPDDSNWTYIAGQYMIFSIPQPGDDAPIKRLYSIASHPENTASIDFLIEHVPQGVGSTFITELSEGSQVTLQGPAGIFIYKSHKRDPIMLATGTGVAPMIGMLRHELQTNTASSPRTYRLLWGLKQAADLYLREELKELAQAYPNFSYRICLSREPNMPEGDEFVSGRVTLALENMLAQEGKTYGDFDYYLCGGKMVVEGLKTYLTEKGAPSEQVYFEKFT